MNDAVAVAMYQTLLSFVGSTEFGAAQVFEALGLFVAKLLGSTVVGVLLAAAASYLLKRTAVHDPHLALATVVCTGYLAYALCEGIKLSGILAVFFAGFAIKHYTYYAMPASGRAALGPTLKTAAYLAEASIYVNLGIAFFVDPASQRWDAALASLSLLLCLVGRAANVFPLTAIANPLRSNKVSFKFQVRHPLPPAPRLHTPQRVAQEAMFLSTCLSVYLSLCLSVCLSVCLSLCLSVCLCVCLSVCPSVLHAHTSLRVAAAVYVALGPAWRDRVRAGGDAAGRGGAAGSVCEQHAGHRRRHDAFCGCLGDAGAAVAGHPHGRRDDSRGRP
jgi:NhaP-type Na+/H+ or K+/H+ antiporter